MGQTRMSGQPRIDEPARQIPVADACDVAVVGGGIAGVAAAVAAARNGARVCLLERYCALGGLATLGNVTKWLPLCDGMGSQVIGGLGEELLRRSVAGLRRERHAAGFHGIPECWQPQGDLEARKRRRFKTGFNPASYLLALEELVADAGIRLLYDTRFCALRCDGRRVTHVIVENKSGRNAIACRTLVDATGDADVCFAAGEETVSLNTNVPAGWFYTIAGGDLQLHVLSKEYSRTAARMRDDEASFRGDDAGHVTALILHTRAMVRKKIADMRERHSADDVQIIMPATTACFRMTRRLVAGYTLSAGDVHQWFDDTIGLTGDWRQAGPVYAIPLRCLRARHIANLVVAGRCISVDSTAWDALRAIPPCVVTGEAAGTAAALASAQCDGRIHQLPYRTLRKRLLDQGVILRPELVSGCPSGVNG